jgi:amino acid adenylation domain-containing protein
MVLLATFIALLGRLTGRDDLVVGILGANRGRRELEDTVGLFVNVLPLRCDLSGDPTFAELLGRVREAALDAYAWQEVPFHLLVEALGPDREASRNPVFQVLFQLADEPAPREGILNWRARELGNGTSKTDLELTLLREGEGLGGYLELDTDLYDPATGERWLGAYRRLLEAMTAAPGERVSGAALLGAAERHQALLEWNDTAEPDPSGPGGAGEGAGSAELFLARAARTPEAVAVARGAEQWSYGELDRRSGALAARLRALGVGPEVRVGVFLRRRPELVAALLGALRAGGAYVPLDPAYPRERVRFMLEDAGVAGVVTEAALEAALPPGAGWRLRVEGVAAEEVASGTLAEAPPDSLSHVIYTSGSTGRPKGVGIRRGSAAALVAWAGSAFGAELRRAVAATTSVCFDLSVFELFAPLARGGRVVLLEDALELARADAAAGAMLVNTVPSVLTELLAAAGLPESVTTVNLAGEALPRPLVEALHRRPGVQAVWNLYGPSEDTTYSTAERVPPGSEEPPAIGRPLPGTRALVVDRGLRAVPPGSEGELCLGGAGLARGYLGRPAATAERFVPDPFAASCGSPGGRLYRTGDRVRRLPDGRLAYLGRLDQQVKLRGFRIEPGEVEAALATLPGVRECAVAAVHLGSPGEGRLTAWVAGDALDADPDGGALRRLLEERLPGHLVPTAFVVLPALPRTPGGKLDRRALPAPPARPAGHGAAPVEPRTPTEAILAGLWREVLGLDRVGVTEDFFRLGGHSLKALHVTTRIRTLFGLDLPLAVLFRAPTIERMASLIDGGSSYGRSPLVRLDLPARPAADAPGALPFFCVHGVGGNVFRLVDLARLVGRPFYGLQGWSDLEDVEHLDAVDKMARRYLAEVRRVQPSGPYLLGGLCVGSMVAFEMARTLEEEGEPVAFVGVINTEMSDLAATTSLGEQRFEAGIARELRIPVSADRLRELSPEERLGYVLEEGRRLRALPEGFTLRDAERYIEIFRRNFTAALNYRPEPCGLRVTLFVATGDEGGPAPAGDPTCGWGRYAGGGVEVLEIPGDNASMLRSPQVEVLAATLAAALDAAEAAALGPGGLAPSRTPSRAATRPAPAARRASGGGEPR